MTTGTGTAAFAGFAIEGTKNTRQAPNRWVPITQEALKCEQTFLKSQGLNGGRRYPVRKTKGTKSIAGPVTMELQAETIASALRACLGGTVVTTGAGPYTHTIAGGALPSTTWQIMRPFAGLTTLQPFDYIGCMVNTWTLSQNPNEFGSLQLDMFAYDEVTDQSAGTYAPAATITPLTFQSLTITTPDGAVCFDSFTLSGTNAIEQSFKSCATDAGRAVIREAGQKSVTGSLQGDFAAITAYSRYLAGTEGPLVIAYNAGASAQLTLTMNVFYTGETPNVTGPGVVKQGIPFEVISTTSDAAAITAVLINTDTTA